MKETDNRSGRRAIVVIVILLGPALVAGVTLLRREGGGEAARAEKELELAQQVHTLCAACHAYPPPESFPHEAWEKEVVQGYKFAAELRPDLHRPSMNRVIEYYRSRAPESLEASVPAASSHPPVEFRQVGDGEGSKTHAVSNVNVVRLFDGTRPEILACDMWSNVVKLLRPYQPGSGWEEIASVPHPARTEVVDLDGDGVKDILVACLGCFPPSDDLCGKVVWLRGNASGGFTPITLLEGVGRVSDARAADFDGDGKLDIVVGVFGWRKTGSLLLLENRTTDWAKSVFAPRQIDPRHGTIHVPVADLNNDGRPDFVALISQEHETVVAFINEGGFRFRMETIFSAPHPAYGSSGIEVVNMDGDGDLDVLYTAGDSLDNTTLIRPEHGVYYLENRGGYPFVDRKLAALPGAHRAVPADFDGDGDLDIVAVSFLPRDFFAGQKDHDSVLFLEQVAPGRFERHALKRDDCVHATVAAGDLSGEGRIDFVTGNFTFFEKVEDSVTVWRNRGKRPDK